MNLLDSSTIKLGRFVGITLVSGGICDNNVVIDISSGTFLELSGGQMLLGSTCTIKGQGELLVSAGNYTIRFKT